MIPLTTMTISFGDKVTHPNFPEWGNGSVIKVESTAVRGEPTARVTVRFSSAGLKSFVGNDLPLEVLVDGHSMPGDRDLKRPAIAEVEDLERSGLTQAVEQKLQEIMHAIPLACRDPFNTSEHRLRRTLDLYKYDMSGKGLMMWAMSQTGMDDPLTRFNRTELEVYFKHYSHGLNKHLSKLLAEMHGESKLINQLLSEAPPRAKRAVEKAKSS
tara:strand:- start:271 stop:909 length:639 start_codon:yes stop_codon:yes gene_type:complete